MGQNAGSTTLKPAHWLIKLTHPAGWRPITNAELRRARGGRCNKCPKQAHCMTRISGNLSEIALCGAGFGMTKYIPRNYVRGKTRAVLEYCEERGVASARVIAEATGINQHTVACALGRLKARGLISDSGADHEKEEVYESVPDNGDAGPRFPVGWLVVGCR